MFSFHKPKIYRSNLGCCICKAKSSSSRFTDSTKYESEFERCFRIQEKRSGEICNACVLLVKRWKKLSPENRLTKHWHHVVDARAGPGTKLTGNRRITNNHHSNHSTSGDQQSSSRQQQRSSSGSGKSEVLPLGSCQVNNQSNNTGGMSLSSGTTRTRASSFSKVCAIDTNVSTFTFGEPCRRSYMNTEPSYHSSIAKPQSALNSSAFESVIKRFRQRQQQEKLEAQRRQLNRKQRLQHKSTSVGQRTEKNVEPKDETTNSTSPNADEQDNTNSQKISGSKRLKRSSECFGSISIETNRISSILDNSMWRKEKICCGIIFRGPYNEIAVFPKMLRQCTMGKEQHQSDAVVNAKNIELDQSEDANVVGKSEDDDILKQSDSPPPRSTKSGSISSCDSSTSGTGSMDQQNTYETCDEKSTSSGVIGKRPTSLNTNKLLQAHKRQTESTSDDVVSASSSGKDVLQSPSASSSISSQIMLLGGEQDLDDDDDAVILGEDDVTESSNDASSSSIDTHCQELSDGVGSMVRSR